MNVWPVRQRTLVLHDVADLLGASHAVSELPGRRRRVQNVANLLRGSVAQVLGNEMGLPVELAGMPAVVTRKALQRAARGENTDWALQARDTLGQMAGRLAASPEDHPRASAASVPLVVISDVEQTLPGMPAFDELG